MVKGIIPCCDDLNMSEHLIEHSLTTYCCTYGIVCFIAIVLLLVFFCFLFFLYFYLNFETTTRAVPVQWEAPPVFGHMTARSATHRWKWIPMSKDTCKRCSNAHDISHVVLFAVVISSCCECCSPLGNKQGRLSFHHVRRCASVFCQIIILEK